MRDKKRILTAVILSGSVGLGAQTIFAQTGSRPIENPTSEKQFETKGRSGTQEQGSGGMKGGTGSREGLETGSRPIERGASESQFEERGEKGPGRAAKVSAADVQNIKEALKAKGHNPGPMNGSMDTQTQQAIREFQRTNNLRVTGEVDQQTAEKLGVTIGGQKGSRKGEQSTAPRSGGSSSERVGPNK
jgi:Putative peptidoglycan binding domain